MVPKFGKEGSFETLEDYVTVNEKKKSGKFKCEPV